jgi:hypothetical protein
MRRQEVYFARCMTPFGTPMGAIKVGCSHGHELRLRAIGSNQPYNLNLIGTVPGGWITEAMVHLYLRRHRVAGEFFFDNQYVVSFVEAALSRDRAFHFIEDAGSGDNLPAEAFAAFMDYHGLTIELVCEYLERDPSPYVGKVSGLKNRKLIAGALIAAQRADGPCGRYVHWPRDCIFGLLGQRHPNARPALPDLAKEAA